MRLCIRVKLQGLHRAAPKQLDQESDQSLCCKEKEDLQGAEWNRGRHVMCDHVSLITLSARSLVKLPIEDKASV